MLQICIPILLLMSAPTTDKVDLASINDQKAIIQTAKSLINSNYKYGGKSPSGFDCSGFTQYVFKKALNIKLPPSSKLQSKKGKTVKLKKTRPGDLIFFKRSGRINHVGIVYKADKKSLWVIHSTSSKGVILEDINRSSYWKSKIYSIKRII